MAANVSKAALPRFLRQLVSQGDRWQISLAGVWRQYACRIGWSTRSLNAGGAETPLGTMPRYTDLDWSGLDPTQMNPPKFAELTSLDPAKWAAELMSHNEFFSAFGQRIPAEFRKIQGRVAQAFGPTVTAVVGGPAAGASVATMVESPANNGAQA